jgi:hypothetical protein
MNILSQINHNKKSIDINKLSYNDHITEYPIANIVNDLDWKNIIDPPSPNSSKKTYKEMIDVYSRTKQRSKEQIDIIQKIDFNPNYFLSDLIERLDLTFPIDILKEMYSVSKPILINIKNLFNRPRPYQLGSLYDLDFNIIVTSTHHTPSYPSGHTFYTALAANIIADKYPQLKNELDRIVEITANARINQGVHYKSDNDASIVLAKFLYNYLNNKIYGKK